MMDFDSLYVEDGCRRGCVDGWEKRGRSGGKGDGGMGCPQGKGKWASWSLFHQHPAPSCPKMEVASPAQSNRLAAVPATAVEVPRYVPRQVQAQGTGTGGHARWVSAARGCTVAASRAADWLTKGERPDPSFIVASRSRWPAALCQLPEQQCTNTGLQLRIV